jgi:hypothetical protein
MPKVQGAKSLASYPAALYSDGPALPEEDEEEEEEEEEEEDEEEEEQEEEEGERRKGRKKQIPDRTRPCDGIGY